VNQSRAVIRVLSFESEDTLPHLRDYSEWMLEGRMGAILEPSFSEFLVSSENLVSRLLADTELGTDISNPSTAIEARLDKLFSF